MSAPLPPSDLASRDPDLVTLPAGAIMHRFYTGGYEPIFFDLGPSGRLNAPDGSYGVLYCAKEPSGAFAETFLRTPGRRLIDADLLRRKAYVRLQVHSELSLIRLAGPGLAILGATAEVVHGDLPYDVPQAWSKALFGHPAGADGIAYDARMTTKLSATRYLTAPTPIVKQFTLQSQNEAIIILNRGRMRRCAIFCLPCWLSFPNAAMRMPGEMKATRSSAKSPSAWRSRIRELRYVG